MKAISRNRISKTQRDLVTQEVDKFYSQKCAALEKKNLDRFTLWFTLSLCLVMDKEFSFGEQRRSKLLKALGEQMTDLSKFLTSNTCETKEGVEYDVDYNREQLSRLADYYGVTFDENIFEEIEC